MLPPAKAHVLSVKNSLVTVFALRQAYVYATEIEAFATRSLRELLIEQHCIKKLVYIL